PIKKVEKKPTTKKETAKKKSEPVKKKPDKIHTPKKGTENGDKRAAILRELERKKRLSALKGAKERKETSKDGVEGDVPSSSLGPVDAVLGAYIEKCRQSILQNWSVLPTIVQKNPDLSVLLEVRVSASGSISKIKVYKSSGNASFDRSAVMALNKTAKLPSPPNKYQKSAAGGILIQLDAKDKTL
ncbi:MAG: energy transducer TonB, partial [Myxococcota bacterium]|nr:energy transducer TonB [Myxococcota bacterium]